MTYEETLEYLYARLPMYQRQGKIAYKKDLTNTIKLMDYLDNPHEKFRSIHIAGTNGKGTSAHGIAAILQKSGYKVGLYTSPHLKSFTERIRINGQEVNESFVISFVERIQPAIDEIEPSFFEITVAMAVDYFATEKVDIAIIETGLGGRLDSTNVIHPEVCLITNIGFDHMDLLGNTLTEIAQEKAGIIKSKVPVVIGSFQEETWHIFEKKAASLNAPISLAEVSDWKASELTPRYLEMNYAGIKSVINELVNQGWEIDETHISEGIEQMNELTGLKGRFQVLSKKPLIITDVSHNVDGLIILFDQVSKLSNGTIHLIFGTVKDKSLSPIFNIFPKRNLKIYWTQSNVPRSLKVEELAIHGVMQGLEGECFKDVNEAITVAKEKVQPEDIILITGSTFVVGEVDDL